MDKERVAYIGIDPGKSGFVCELRETIWLTPTPTVDSGRKREYDVGGMTGIIQAIKQRGTIALCVLEKQTPMPGQGVTSMFSIGYGFGLWEGILMSLGISYVVVHPRTWKKEMLRDVPGTTGKGRSILAAQRLFPDVGLRRSERARKPDHNAAEALLLAEYANRLCGKEHGHTK